MLVRLCAASLCPRAYSPYVLQGYDIHAIHGDHSHELFLVGIHAAALDSNCSSAGSAYYTTHTVV